LWLYDVFENLIFVPNNWHIRTLRREYYYYSCRTIFDMTTSHTDRKRIIIYSGSKTYGAHINNNNLQFTPTTIVRFFLNIVFLYLHNRLRLRYFSTVIVFELRYDKSHYCYARRPVRISWVARPIDFCFPIYIVRTNTHTHHSAVGSISVRFPKRRSSRSASIIILFIYVYTWYVILLIDRRLKTVYFIDRRHRNKINCSTCGRFALTRACFSSGRNDVVSRPNSHKSRKDERLYCSRTQVTNHWHLHFTR